jgi:hypothetical protein
MERKPLSYNGAKMGMATPAVLTSTGRVSALRKQPGICAPKACGSGWQTPSSYRLPAPKVFRAKDRRSTRCVRPCAGAVAR